MVAFDMPERLTRADVDRIAALARLDLSEAERAAYIATQRQAIRWTFIGSGMSHPNFLFTVDRLRPGARERLEAIVPTFC